MILKIRVILDNDEDVFRDIVIDGYQSLEDLHHVIVNSFTLNPEEMASFYKTDDEWNQKDEISLMDFEEDDTLTMNKVDIQEMLNKPNSRLLYVNDFMHMWTFYVEVVSIEKDFEGELPQVTLVYGNMPTDAPEILFESGKPIQSTFDSIFDDDEEEDDEGYYDIEDYEEGNY